MTGWATIVGSRQSRSTPRRCRPAGSGCCRLGRGVYSGHIESPGAFSLSNIPSGSNYVLTAFLDVNGNQAQDVGEPSGVFAGSPFDLTDDLSQTVVTLTEPPTLSTQPHDTRVGPETARFMVDALGTKPFTYQWLKDGFPLPDGPNAAELVISNASAQDEGVLLGRGFEPEG